MADKVTIAFVINGHSQYHDDVWRWLNDKIKETHWVTGSYDYIEVTGLFALAGCEIAGCYGVDDGEGEEKRHEDPSLRISWHLSIKELIERLNEIITY
jgi:hypothetical protein